MISLSEFYKSVFGCKVYKVAIDAGCTCPNRDGSKGVGGCIFCSESGSGEFASSRRMSISEQIEEGKKRIMSKLRGRSGGRNGKFIAYFQNFTSTYGNADELCAKYSEALSCDDVVGIAIATRPDSLGEKILDFLAETSQSRFVQIELGLQTSNENTGALINRCYTDADYENAVRMIKSRSPKIHIVTHLIFGLPNETESDMMNSVDFVLKNKTDGIKITVLYVLENTRLAQMYFNSDFSVLSKDEYFSLVSKAAAKFPDDLVVHRLTGDPPKSLLIEPQWTCDKKKVMNEMRKIIFEKNEKKSF
ncbi:MAG: TIGR01212 family radical SAM protein [Treponema sp.]|nr:TIGR01212 family radical SAM protein [Treponema sp.]